MSDLAKLVNNHFKVKFVPDLVCIILFFFEKYFISNLNNEKHLLRSINQYQVKNYHHHQNQEESC